MGDASLNCFVLCWIRLDAVLSSIIQSKSFQLLKCFVPATRKVVCVVALPLPNNIPLHIYFPPPFSISFRSETHNTSPIAKKVLIPLQTTSEIGDVLHFGSAISVSTFTYIPSTTIIALVAVFQLNYIYCMNWSTTLVYYWCIYNIEWAAKWNGPISQ